MARSAPLNTSSTDPVSTPFAVTGTYGNPVPGTTVYFQGVDVQSSGANRSYAGSFFVNPLTGYEPTTDAVTLYLETVTTTQYYSAPSVLWGFEISQSALDTLAASNGGVINQTQVYRLALTDAQSDTLIGGAGNDNFVFNSPFTQVDTIADFTSGSDHLQINGAGFGGLSAGVDPTVFNAASAAAVFYGNGGFFIFDAAGDLWWDQNGDSGADATPIAHLQGVPPPCCRPTSMWCKTKSSSLPRPGGRRAGRN